MSFYININRLRELDENKYIKMKKGKGRKKITIDDIFTGKANFEGNDAYVKTKNGHTLRTDLSEKENAEAKHRWENGGKEIHDKWMEDPKFTKTEEYKNYFKKW